MRFLGVDYGSKRVGIAVSDEAGEFAMPLVVLQQGKDMSTLVGNIRDIILENKINTIVIGESKSYDGKMNPIMKEITPFKKMLEEMLNTVVDDKNGEVMAPVQVIYEPEFMTSMNAERVRKELNGTSEFVDASAAALILQSFLDKKKK